MTPAQQDAINRLAVAEAARSPTPVRIASATARILHERYGFIEPAGDGWKLTPRGRSTINRDRQRERHRAVEAQLLPEHRAWADRVDHWLRAHEIFEKHFLAQRYARHVAACDRAGIEPVCEEVWPNESRAYVEARTRAAARILTSFDEEREIAKLRGVGITIDYEASEKVPRSRKQAACEAADGQVVNLRMYRERRP